MNNNDYIMITDESICYINSIKSSKEEKEINLLIKELLGSTKGLISEVNENKLIFKLIKFLNKILASKSGVDESICAQLDECLIKTLADIKFEKEVLLELKQYLKDSKKNKEYDNLDRIFVLLISTIYFRDCTKENYITTLDIWKNALKGINYIPPKSIEMNAEDLKEPIKYGLQKLKNKAY